MMGVKTTPFVFPSTRRILVVATHGTTSAIEAWPMGLGVGVGFAIRAAAGPGALLTCPVEFPGADVGLDAGSCKPRLARIDLAAFSCSARMERMVPWAIIR